jgi:hypothetical protein
MTWNMTGQMLEACSCKMLCPCALGPAEPDQGWCAGALVFDIQRGQADGVGLDRTTVVLVVNLPGDFLGGNGTARLFIDDGASAAQRQELEALFMGQRGGPLGAVAALFTHSHAGGAHRLAGGCQPVPHYWECWPVDVAAAHDSRRAADDAPERARARRDWHRE